MKFGWLAVVALVAGCADPGSPNCPSDLRVQISPRSEELTVGESFTASVELLGCAGTIELSDTFAFVSRNTSVATAAASGTITAVGAGETLVDVSGEKYHTLGVIEITVTEPEP